MGKAKTDRAQNIKEKSGNIINEEINIKHLFEDMDNEEFTEENE